MITKELYNHLKKMSLKEIWGLLDKDLVFINIVLVISIIFLL